MSNNPVSNFVQKPVYKKWWFWLIAIIIAGIAGQLDESEIAADDILQAGLYTSAATQVKNIASIGETIIFDDSRWVVISAQDIGQVLESNNTCQREARTAGKFILVSFSVLNTNTREERIPDHPKLEDSMGREYKNYDQQDLYIPKNAQTFTMSSLPAGLEKKFWAVYEVPADCSGFLFKVRPLSASGKAVPVDLGI